MKKIRLKTGKRFDYSTTISVKGINYFIQTEEATSRYPFITSTAYLEGRIVEKIKSACLSKDSIGENEFHELMHRQHNEMIKMIQEKHLETKRSESDYIKGIGTLIKKNRLKDAYDLVEDAMLIFPDDPFIMSYCGYLRAVLFKQYNNGIAICKKALSDFKKGHKISGYYFEHFFYLNLGKAYLAAGKKNMAIQYVRNGLKYDKNNKELIKMLIRLGMRKKPPIPFIRRDSIVNKYLGLLFSKAGLR
ncbi:hypothetical protein BMS3Abin07_01831 [bacterium BMS3Abin07]|nr:hypothetical protein BMS3Abin07_01831 [bacterium BMS3Abin07]GBE32004.1 hypothetical protein BMS3Bbin05_00912 [bacterium BMS3Bbin05]HDO21418.1 hypothetical protein [Nitrospirota bacterium]